MHSSHPYAEMQDRLGGLKLRAQQDTPNVEYIVIVIVFTLFESQFLHILPVPLCLRSYNVVSGPELSSNSIELPLYSLIFEI